MQEMQETQTGSLGREDALEKGMATHSSTLAWSIPWREEPGGYSPRGHNSVTNAHTTHAQHILTPSVYLKLSLITYNT